MGLPSIKISCAGRPLPDHIEIIDVEIQLAINRVPQASLTLLDGSLPDQRFGISEERLLAPGARVSIALGYSNARDRFCFTAPENRPELAQATCPRLDAIPD